MNGRELSEEEAVTKILRAVASKHAKRAVANPPDLNDPDAVVKWLEGAAKAAEEEFDRLMGVMPPQMDARTARVRNLMNAQ